MTTSRPGTGKTSTSTERPTHCFLLFAGSQQPGRGGLSDLVQTFDSEDAARDAFHQIRLAQSSPASWAQLAVVDGQNRLKPLCWFGIGAEPHLNRAEMLQAAGAVVVAGPARRPRVSKVTAFLLTALVAAATATIGFLVDNEGPDRVVGPRTPSVSLGTWQTTLVPPPTPPSAAFPSDGRGE